MTNQHNDILEHIVTYQVFLPEILALLHDLLFYALRNNRGTLETDVTRLNDYFEIIHPRMVNRIRDDPYQAQEFMSKIKPVFTSGQITAALLQDQLEKGWTPAFLCLCCIVYGISRDEWAAIADQCSPHFQKLIPSICIYFRRTEGLVITETDTQESQEHMRMMALVLGNQGEQLDYEHIIVATTDQHSEADAEAESAENGEANEPSSSSSSSPTPTLPPSSSSPLDAHSSLVSV